MKWAVAKGYRSDNPAGDAIAAALPRNGNATRHHQALRHGEVSAALVKVRNSGSHAGVRLALEFMVLTATRSNEVRGATWDEFDHDVWTIPASRMKAKRAHRVPLSRRALEILEEARKRHDGGGIVFRGAKGGGINASMFSGLLRGLGIEGTPHGMRSSFRDWCSETGVAREVAEAALAHVVKNRVEAAYARSDLLERRREVVEAWADYLASERREPIEALAHDRLEVMSQLTLWGHASRVPGRGWRGAVPPLTPQRQRHIMDVGRGRLPPFRLAGAEAMARRAEALGAI